MKLKDFDFNMSIKTPETSIRQVIEELETVIGELKTMQSMNIKSITRVSPFAGVLLKITSK